MNEYQNAGQNCPFCQCGYPKMLEAAVRTCTTK